MSLDLVVDNTRPSEPGTIAYRARMTMPDLRARAQTCDATKIDTVQELHDLSWTCRSVIQEYRTNADLMFAKQKGSRSLLRHAALEYYLSCEREWMQKYIEFQQRIIELLSR